MTKFSKLGAAVLLALGAVSTGAYASINPVINLSTSGSVIKWDETAPGVLTPNPAATLDSLLAGNAAAPGGNIELSKFGGPVSTLSGTVNGIAVSFDSLTLADWQANNDSLTKSYISAAYAAALGGSVPGSLLSAAIAGFYAPNAALAGKSPWQLVSDPNISYAYYQKDPAGGASLKVGLGGLYDATNFLNALVAGVPGAPVLTGLNQASEVVKVTYNGSTSYLYGFNATPSGVHAIDGVSYAGNYEVSLTVPEPSTLALLGVGVLGAALRRRRSV